MKLSRALFIITLLFLTASAFPISSREATPLSRRSPQDDAETLAAELAAQNEMQARTTEEEFAQKMNDAAWKTASSAAGDNIQRRSASPSPQDATDAALLAAELAAQNQIQAQTAAEEFAQQMNDAAWKTASSVASDKIQRRSASPSP
jgi:hypothetical protein